MDKHQRTVGTKERIPIVTLHSLDADILDMSVWNYWLISPVYNWDSKYVYKAEHEDLCIHNYIMDKHEPFPFVQVEVPHFARRTDGNCCCSANDWRRRCSANQRRDHFQDAQEDNLSQLETWSLSHSLRIFEQICREEGRFYDRFSSLIHTRTHSLTIEIRCIDLKERKRRWIGSVLSGLSL